MEWTCLRESPEWMDSPNTQVSIITLNCHAGYRKMRISSGVL